MFFILKKVVGSMLLPLPFLLLLMATGLLLLWFSRWQQSGKILLSVSWLLLLLFSLQPVADRLLLPLESHYPTWNGAEKVDYIVVLGGGYTFNPNWAPSSNLVGNSLPRVTEGVRQWHRYPDATLIFTGAAAGQNSKSNAWVAANVAESLGVPREKIHILDRPKDTEEEAQAVRRQIGYHSFLLVSSANHLPRAMQFFQAAGLNPIAAPANQLAIASPLNGWERVIPSPIWLGHSERAIYETLGQAWQRLKSDDLPSTEPGK
ncbi:MAG: envelope biogenesis factor ElyC [Enterobacterales bacterium endosymbiont of Blomia tropicalis]|uniref:envelope biogenesis factor ElyC n=1 Tax=Mixta mediterraneensis TaxID=2758443 RepID=UPI0025A863D9|nr:envelope biogenesis factor ElyC [Mixta mediterraneensis]MDL4913392.1 envelope biogenesis factor ElyC [Mixta mediterraneensis]